MEAASASLSNYYGDCICDESLLPVNEVIKIYETSSSRESCCNEGGSSNEKLKTNSCQESPAASSNQLRKYSFSDLRNVKPSKDSVISASSDNLTDDCNNSRTYKSRTCIQKTPTGIKIVTEIKYNLSSADKAQQDSWPGRKIETSIMKSKVIEEFQAKMN